MYVPKHHEEHNVPLLHRLIRDNPLGTWITLGDTELIANHLPFFLDVKRGEFGTLVGHVAKANRVWQDFSRSKHSLVTFQGVDTYITPNWYPSKHETGKAVPTWNYAVVHARGMPRVVEDRDWLLDHLTQLTVEHESRQSMPWKITDAPQEFIDRLIQNIVGIEIPIERLIGKWKISQNRPEPDRFGIVDGLSARGDDKSNAMAQLIKQLSLGSSE